MYNCFVLLKVFAYTDTPGYGLKLPFMSQFSLLVRMRSNDVADCFVSLHSLMTIVGRSSLNCSKSKNVLETISDCTLRWPAKKRFVFLY